MRNDLVKETLLRQAEDTLRGALTPGWSLERVLPRGSAFDAEFHLTTPSGEAAHLPVAVKRWSTAPSSAVTGVLTDLQSTSRGPVLLVTDYANPPLRAACEQLGLSFVDSTGWIYLEVHRPAILIRAEGDLRRPPTRKRNEVDRLNGKASGRLIRTLLAASPPIGVRALAERAGTSPGSAAKLLPTLAREGAIERNASGTVTLVRRRGLLRRWTADYGYLTGNGLVSSFVAPRGLQRSVAALGDIADQCATGSAAARTYLPPDTISVSPVTTLMLYCADPHQLADDLGLVQADRPVSNVLVAVPQDPDVIRHPDRAADGLPRAPLGLVLADLLTMPGRSSQEAEQLMDVLAADDESWSR